MKILIILALSLTMITTILIILLPLKTKWHYSLNKTYRQKVSMIFGTFLVDGNYRKFMLKSRMMIALPMRKSMLYYLEMIDINKHLFFKRLQEANRSYQEFFKDTHLDKKISRQLKARSEYALFQSLEVIDQLDLLNYNQILLHNFESYTNRSQFFISTIFSEQDDPINPLIISKSDGHHTSDNSAMIGDAQ
ncbi:hypothetical protein [Vagococcus silagei]|uniref:Uncharacterized protein n=1 Tax=Vagococcus silagei TaxID=2508885 RepID=A0A4S3B508_9ENTE|nr:hypothetical protein [Vagococcus silagei]THB60703.1 hypothetical protein ESZ54_08925 [Vagococcus silagei]